MVLELECKVNTESVGTDGRILVTLVGTCGIADARNLRIETCITGDGFKVVNGTINTETLDEIVLETEVVTEGHVVDLPVVTILDIVADSSLYVGDTGLCSGLFTCPCVDHVVKVISALEHVVLEIGVRSSVEELLHVEDLES